MAFKQSVMAALLVLSTGLAQAECLNTEPGKVPAEQLKNNRMECLSKARFVLNQPDVSAETLTQLLTHPKSKRDNFKNGEVVYCNYVYQKQNGNSAKFRCARTNEHNQLMDSKGEVVPQAVGLVSEGDEVYLTDINNKKIMIAGKNEKEKPRKALIMKIRYQDGTKRNVENYASSAASRIFWALGIPAHSNYMTEKVVCLGCGPNPFRDQQKELPMITEFRDASIEVKYDGERLYKPTQEPWKWSELNALSKTATNEIRIELEVLALAAHFVGAVGKTYMQNAIVCTEFDKENKNVCTNVVAMIHDIGASFGSRTNRPLFGGDYPRGDLGAYNSTSIFREGSCEFSLSDGGRELPPEITSAGKNEFLKRAAILTKENLKTIFAASHMGTLHNEKKKNVSSLEDKWVRATEEKLNEIKQAPCR